MKVDAVQHFLYGIAIDEGYEGNRANILAWDVLYPEVIYSDVNLMFLSLIADDFNCFKEMNYEEAVLYMYYVDNLLN